MLITHLKIRPRKPEKSFYPGFSSKPTICITPALIKKETREAREKENRPQHLLENWWCGIICSRSPIIIIDEELAAEDDPS